MNPSLESLQKALHIKEQITNLESQLSKILGGEGPYPFKKIQLAAPAKTKFIMSAAAKAKISKAVKARWAKVKSTTKPAAKPVKKKSKMSAAAKAKLSALMKARWAARKKGAPALNAPKKK